MQSTIVISKNLQTAKDYVINLAKAENISIFDIYFQESEKITGILEIKNFAKQVFLKPLNGNQKIVALECFSGITIDGQNAFLKTLEEPPVSTTIFILARENNFLSTIVSRCKIITLDNQTIIEKEEQETINETITNLPKMTIGEKLKLAETLAKDKEKALQYLEKFMILMHEKMLTENPQNYANQLILIQKYFKEIKESNVNLRLGLENLFLSLS